MTLEKKFQMSYGKCSYNKQFSKDFREAVRGIDIISKAISKPSQEKQDPKKR